MVNGICMRYYLIEPVASSALHLMLAISSDQLEIRAVGHQCKPMLAIPAPMDSTQLYLFLPFLQSVCSQQEVVDACYENQPPFKRYKNFHQYTPRSSNQGFEHEDGVSSLFSLKKPEV
eukprot:1161655-Pelagomonas_calceolata.AAC.3